MLIAAVFILAGGYVFFMKVFTSPILNGALGGALVAAGASMLIRKKTP